MVVFLLSLLHRHLKVNLNYIKKRLFPSTSTEKFNLTPRFGIQSREEICFDVIAS
jgi:hypothetical protein